MLSFTSMFTEAYLTLTSKYLVWDLSVLQVLFTREAPQDQGVLWHHLWGEAQATSWQAGLADETMYDVEENVASFYFWAVLVDLQCVLARCVLHWNQTLPASTVVSSTAGVGKWAITS